MSTIVVKNFDAFVTKRELSKLFSTFGRIKKIEIANPDKKKNNKAHITFADDFAAYRALAKDRSLIRETEIHVLLSGGWNKNKITSKSKLFSVTDIISICAVVLVSLYLRLPKLSYPNKVIYDEVKYGDFINQYYKGIRFFDSNPHFSKIILYGYLKYFCRYNGTFKFTENSEYPDGLAFKLRLLPALCGSFAPGFITAGLIVGFYSRPLAIAAGLIIAFDFGMITRSRLFTADGLVFLYVSITIYFTFLIPRRETWVTVFMQCLFTAFSVSSNFNTLPLVILVALSNYHLTKNRLSGLYSAAFRTVYCLIACLIIAYFSTFVHITLTPKPGVGDLYVDKYFRSRDTVAQIGHLLWAMLRFKKPDTRYEMFSSKWWTWPTRDATPILVWNDWPNAAMLIFESPVAAGTAAVGAILSLLFGRADLALTYAAALAGYGAFRMYTFITQYSTAVMIGVAAAAVVFDRLPALLRTPIACAVVAFSWVMLQYWKPLVYGSEISGPQLVKRIVWPTVLAALDEQ